MKDALGKPEPWSTLRRWTSARIAMGRAGASLPTAPLLEFNMDHARARDAVHAVIDVEALAAMLREHGFESLHVASRARDRAEYLRRPDLGRRLDADCVAALEEQAPSEKRLTVVIADGLSALAPSLHALPVLLRLRDALPEWEIDCVIATQVRVALADEIGELRGAEVALILIGERPGLKTPDSLGAYLTYRPRIGRMDAERNCVSNIRPDGLSYDEAAFRLARLVRAARAMGASGTRLKQDGDAIACLPEAVERPASLRSE